jgi:hypothetical protein
MSVIDGGIQYHSRASSGDISSNRKERPITPPMMLTCSRCVRDSGQHVIAARVIFLERGAGCDDRYIPFAGCARLASRRVASAQPGRYGSTEPTS